MRSFVDHEANSRRRGIPLLSRRPIKAAHEAPAIALQRLGVLQPSGIDRLANRGQSATHLLGGPSDSRTMLSSHGEDVVCRRLTDRA